MKNVPYKIGESKQNFTSRAGLPVMAELMQRFGLAELANRLMALPGSSRGYLSGTLFQTFMLMLHEGGRCLDDVRELHHEKGTDEAVAPEADSECAYAGQRVMSDGSKRAVAGGFCGAQQTGPVGGKIVHHAWQLTLQISSTQHRKIERVWCQIWNFPLLF